MHCLVNSQTASIRSAIDVPIQSSFGGNSPPRKILVVMLGSELGYHPHVHAIVTAGGLTESGWKPMSLTYLFPVEVMGELLRGKIHNRGRLWVRQTCVTAPVSDIHGKPFSVL